MDPINYIPQSSQRLPSHGDSPAGPWMADAHNVVTSPWPPHSSVSPLYFPQTQPPRSQPNPDPLPFGLQISLPHPDRSVRGQQQSHRQDSFPASHMPQPHHWGSALHPISGLASAGSASQGGAGGRTSHPSEREMQAGTASGHGGRDFALQPQGTVSMAPPGATSETQAHSLLVGGSLFSSPSRLANAYGQRSASHLSTPHHHPLDLTPPRRVAQDSSSVAPTTNTPRTHQHLHGLTSSVPAASRDSSALPSPVSDRRRQGLSRARRYMTSRHTAPDPPRDGEADDEGRQTASEPNGGRPARRGSLSSNPAALWDEAAVRQLQLVRGAAPSKMVASRMALRSLLSVDMNELLGNERTCVICYNDFGVESPEGINEAPLRLPKCKHVFGDHCIKKWFEDSDSCPYCRDKLPSEPKQTPSQGSARAFMNMMRMRGVPLPAGVPDHFYSRLMTGAVGEAEILQAMAARHGRTAERRSAPDDAPEEDQRRTRQRRSSPAPHDHPSLDSSGGRAAPRLTTSSPNAQSLFASWQPNSSIWGPVPPHTPGSTRQQDAGQNRLVDQPPPPPLFANSSQPLPLAFPSATSARTHARMAAHLQSQDSQRAREQRASMGPFSIRNDEQQQLDQQLQRQPSTSLSGVPSSSIPRLRPAPPGNIPQGSAAQTVDRSEQAQSETSLSGLGPGHNRLW